jgi:hypothetical protein
MSLIHTCELNGANPFDYLTELQRHSEKPLAMQNRATRYAARRGWTHRSAGP